MRYLIATVGALVLVGCSTPGAPPPPGTPGTPTANGHQDFISASQLPGSVRFSEHGLTDMYTRVVVSGVNASRDEPFQSLTLQSGSFDADGSPTAGCSAQGTGDCVVDFGTGLALGSRNYKDETRSFLARLLLGRVNTKTAVLNIEVSNPNVSTTSTLAAFTHESTRENGEQFSTEIRQHSVATPYFRIEADATVRMRLEFDLGYSTSSDTITATLATASSALSALAPKARLLTALNQEQVNEAASFFDATISAVLEEDLVEVLEIDNGIEDWLHGQRAVFNISVPDYGARRLAEVGLRPNQEVGSWRVELDLPRISIWSDFSPCWRISAGMICPPAYLNGQVTVLDNAAGLEPWLNYLSPSQVLNFKASETTTLGAFIRDQSWYTSTVSGINAADSDAVATQTTAFCRQVTRVATELGLNRIDSNIALWAILSSEEVNLRARNRALTGATPACADEAEIISALGL